MERHCLFAFQLLLALSFTTVEIAVGFTNTGFCQNNQTGYNGSCYEFVAQQQSFIGAQAGCERSGGHLAFIRNEQTQSFLQQNLKAQYNGTVNNWWLGFVSASFNLNSSTTDRLSWLDGSKTNYSNQLGESLLGIGCGYISPENNFQWEVTGDCNQGFFYICEFELGQSLVCVDNQAVLSCDSGKVIQIDEGFYGRQTAYYCKANQTLLTVTTVLEGCSWQNVLNEVSGYCNGHPACQLRADTPAFGQPCPEFGSYLSIKYHCRDEPNLSAGNADNSNSQVENGLYLGSNNLGVMTNLFLPQGSTQLTITIKNSASQSVSTELLVHVTNRNTTLKDVMSDAVAMQKNGTISPANLAQIFGNIHDQMNSNYTEDDKKKLVQNISKALCDAVAQGNTTFPPVDTQIISSTILSLVTNENQLTSNSKGSTSCVLESISKNAKFSLDGYDTVNSAAATFVNSVSILLKVSDSNQQTSESLLRTLDQVQNAMLSNKAINTEPIILNSPLISLYVNRLTPDNLSKSQISSGDNSAAFSLPSSVTGLIPSNETVDMRMLSFGKNPFAWNKEEDISGTVASLSLSKDDGSTIQVENLDEEIEILLPRLDAVATNKTFLNLTSYSTMAINVTAPNISLVVKLEPSDETPLMLNLGFQNYPNDTNYVAKIQLPQQEDSREANYTWVLNPKDVALVGVYYLLVRPIVSPGVNSTNVTVFITSVAATCKYWNEKESSWSESGCRVGPYTTSLVTQCLCTHLTAFGSSFFVMPNTVDVSRTAELFSSFANNPVVVCFVGAIFLAYIIAAIWARRKDLQDKIKVRITVLEDNDPLADYRYLVAVTTGHRHGAATTSHVTLTLTGTVWESKPHHLTDPEKIVFTRGGVDIFMLTTPFSLGDLQSIRLWHDNSGEQPDWYVSKVMVQDLETGQIWHFLCNSWLAIDIGDCTLDKVFPVASEKDLKGFHNVFFTKTAKDLCDGHIWYSVVNRPANSNFTRVQRLSCCFSLLLCTMLTSIMFWGVPKSPAEQDMELGTIKFNIQQVMIGFQSSIIMFPVNLLIVSIFRMTRSRKKKEVAIIQASKSESSKEKKTLAERWRIQTDITFEIVVKDIKKIVRSLARAVRCPVPNAAEESETTDISTLLFALEDIIRQQNFSLAKSYVEDSENDQFLVYKLYRHYIHKQIRNFEKELRLMCPSQFPKQDGYLQAVLQVQRIKQLLEPYLYSNPIGNEVQITSPEEEKKKKFYQKGLPWWFVIVGWILIAATSGVSGYFTMMYGLTYGKERSISWLISISVSFFESLFVTQPIKVLGFAIFFALVVKSIQTEDDNYFRLLKDLTLTYSEDPDDIRISRRDSTSRFYQPPPPSDIEKMKENHVKNLKAIALFKEIIIYLAFLCVLLVATYGQRDPNAYYLTQHIQQSFSNGITDSMTAGDVFNWANNVLISNLYGQRPGFITDGNSKLVGSARLRQIRVKKDTCRISKFMQGAGNDCHAPYSWGIEDMGFYGPGWNHSVDVNIAKTLLIPWQYQTQSKLRGHSIWGNMAFYRGGGFVMDLCLDPQEASSMLQFLFNNTWLDVYTRAIFVEFTVYNANVNLFCIVTLMLETTALGAFQFSSELHNLRLYQTTDGINIVASEVIYFLFILYYMFLQIKRIKQQKMQYFRSKHNLLELAIILLSLAAAGAIINRTIQGERDLKYFQQNKDSFPSFYDTASADTSLGYILAFLILLATIKMWHLMRLNTKLNLITCTLKRAWNDISSYIVVLVIMILAYSIVSNLLFGWILYTYKTLQDSISAIIALQLGIFNYEEILDLNPVLGAFLILSCVIFMTFVVLNLFIAVILEAFSHEQKHYKPSEEEEIVDLMVFKICKMFGVSVKKE
ncbi:polycystic kidney disease protein 1-like 2 [Silurus meridionalis]|uniref:polycystic kidney disease protein 1-like 2 n=1 Tax=Silurus meridionalis TaxID=175797 RepID=UPI001EEC91DE|nr:polycystic kidney disease protein 1-like 2 [Silurus meridionalis]